jgi:HNH endonuclease
MMAYISGDTNRFEHYTERSDSCWEWRGGKRQGYACMWSAIARGNVAVHRWSYEHYIGKIPKGLTIDHLCRNRGCVNPKHMEVVTLGENARRGAVTGINVWAANKTHCPKGHPYDDENTYKTPNGGRACIECRRLATRIFMRKYRALKKAGV